MVRKNVKISRNKVIIKHFDIQGGRSNNFNKQSGSNINFFY